MNCPRCGKGLAPGGAFCPSCGLPVAPSRPSAAPASNLQGAYDLQRKRSTAIAATVGVIALVVGGFIGIRAISALAAPGQGPDGNKLVAQGAKPDNNMLKATGQAAPPSLNRMDERPPQITMPDDIRAWLEHLRKSEAMREQVTKSQIGQALTEKAKLGVMGGADAVKSLLNGIDDPESQIKSPTEALAPIFKQMHDQYREVGRYFQSVPPPSECVPIEQAYSQALRETIAQMGDLSDALAAGDVTPLYGMIGKSNATIDTPGKRADRLVGELCDKYNTAKWFTVNADFAAGNALGAGF